MNPEITALEAKGWTRDITVNGTSKGFSTSYSEKRQRHLNGEGFETRQVDFHQSGRQFVVVMKKPKATIGRRMRR